MWPARKKAVFSRLQTFFRKAPLSFADRIKTDPDDIIERSAEGFGTTLKSPPVSTQGKGRQVRQL